MNYNQDSTSSTPIKFTPGRDNSYSGSSGDLGTKPAGDPRSRKDFRKILGKTQEDEAEEKNTIMEIEEEEEEEDFASTEGDLPKKAPPSLFDLSGTSSASHLLDDDVALTAKQVKESPADVFSKLSSADAKDKYTTRFGTEQTDLSYVNPMMAMLNTQPADNLSIQAGKAQILSASNLQEIINKMVEKAVEMEQSGKTETTVTLKQPPILAGANLILTSFDSAKGEFNIAFENLRPDAKNLLDMQANRDSLLNALHQKGYAVHILTTTTTIEHRPLISDAQATRDQEREQSRQGRQKKRQQDGQDSDQG